MNPVDELTASIEHGTMQTCEAFAADAVLEATVPGWRFSVRGERPVRALLTEWFATPGRFEELRWRLREIMATRGLFTTTHLAPLLAERGIVLSASQIHRLVTGTPERLSLPVLAALCDLLDVTPADLIITRAENTTVRKTAGAGPAELRPTRARLRPEP